MDPFQMNDTPKNADYIFITHDHYDHFSPEDIEKVANDNTILIVPEKMEKKAQEVVKLVARIVTVKPGAYYDVEGLEFETVPAYNLIKMFHPRAAEWVGYILKIGGKRIYIAGDTDATKEAKAVKCDIALVPIGGTYTMDAKKAAELVNAICPDVAIPTHYGSIVGKPEDGEVFERYVKEPTKVECMIKF
jgi:L-ascorbate metabolism protein UlaG (beta-lactamase superfamily)